MHQESKHIHILIADDEALARKRIVKFLSEGGINGTFTEASSGKETLSYIKNQEIDLVFLDIKMTDMSGFEVIQQLPEDKIPMIIFVTAFYVFAVKAFVLQAIDFLLKPYKKVRFYEALDRGLKQLKLEQQHLFQHKVSKLIQSIEGIDPLASKTAIVTSYIDTLVLKSKKKYSFLKVDDIKYIQSASYYAEIYTKTQERHVHRISMTELTTKLDPQLFFRINRSVIVHKSCIQEIISEGVGDYSVIMNDTTSFVLSKKYKLEFLKHMGIK